METIIKTISLEPITSRFPVCYPSLRDGEVLYLNPESEDILNSPFYGNIPLGVNESICGSYSGFTEDMYSRYKDKTLYYHDLQKWMTEFNNYFSLIRSSACHMEYESATDYYERNYPYGDNMAIAEELDTNFNGHGGRNFYNWLIDNYFVTLDLRREYEYIKQECTYLDWLNIIDNIGREYMYYPEVLRFYGEMVEWSKLDCDIRENCCECERFEKFGGSLLLTVMKNWTDRINTNIISNNALVEEIEDELIPSFSLNLLMKSKIEDSGTFVSFTKDFVPGREYTKGEVCSNDGDVYILSANTYSKMVFDGKGWQRYYDVYIESHSGETPYTWSEDDVLSGWCVSSLDLFSRNSLTVDNMGNTLPGYFEPNSGSTFVQPAENTLLDFIYEPGMVNNLTYLKTEEIDGEEIKLYTCELLTQISFFYRDFDEIPISGATAEIGDKVNDVIEDYINYIESLSEITTTGVLYADITYVKNAIVSYYEVETEKYLIKLESKGHISCTDHCTVNLSTCQYYMSPTNSYPLKYYEVVKDVQTVYSDENQAYIDVYMSEWRFKPYYSEVEQYVATPLIRKEELLPFQGVESPVNNIYIDRGYATVLDRYLRIGEIRNYEQLEKYGNGIFQIYNADEEVV